MSTAVLILGESGSGKSTSLRFLEPEKVMLIQAVRKPLPFRSADWQIASKENPEGSVIVTDNSQKICAIMQRTKRDIIVIDDFQYVMANEFMRRVTDQAKGNEAFQKYNEIGRAAWDIFNTAGHLPENKRVYILSHSSTDELGNTKLKTIGRLLDEKIVLEGMLTIVLRAIRKDGENYFKTQNSGNDTVKSPIGMFAEDQIPNDLAAVDAGICEYYGIK